MRGGMSLGQAIARPRPVRAPGSPGRSQVAPRCSRKGSRGWETRVRRAGFPFHLPQESLFERRVGKGTSSGSLSYCCGCRQPAQCHARSVRGVAHVQSFPVRRACYSPLHSPSSRHGSLRDALRVNGVGASTGDQRNACSGVGRRGETRHRVRTAPRTGGIAYCETWGVRRAAGGATADCGWLRWQLSGADRPWTAQRSWRPLRCTTASRCGTRYFFSINDTLWRPSSARLPVSPLSEHSSRARCLERCAPFAHRSGLPRNARTIAKASSEA